MKSLLPFTLICFWLLGCTPPPESNALLTLSSGRIERIENFNSKFIPPRNIDIWLPDGYSPDRKYAVLYMHDGQMLFDSTTTWNKQEWGVDELFGNLLAEKKIPETIVVGIWNTEFRHSEYFPQKPFESLPEEVQDSLLKLGGENTANALFKAEVYSDKYLQFLVEELKPYIDKTYPTRTDKAHTYIAGSSMGGLISMYAICEYPQVFKGAACLSTHWIGIFDTLNNPIPEQMATYLDQYLPDPDTHKLYFDYGTETLDQFYEPYQKQMDTILLLKGYNNKNWMTRKFEGEDHSERAWQRRLDIPILFLLNDS